MFCTSLCGPRTKKFGDPALNYAIVPALAYNICNAVWPIDCTNRCFVAKNSLAYFAQPPPLYISMLFPVCFRCCCFDCLSYLTLIRCICYFPFIRCETSSIKNWFVLATGLAAEQLTHIRSFANRLRFIYVRTFQSAKPEVFDVSMFSSARN